MDQEAKRHIKKLVLDLRHLLEDDLTVVLKRYGIFTDRAWLKPEELPKATSDLLATRKRLEAIMQPDLERDLSPARAAALYVREAAFTHLNRLAGLKALEVRDLFPETIQTRPEYGGRSLYHRDYRADHPEQSAAADDALPAALQAACREVSHQIRFVFDPEVEPTLLWPRYSALKEAINLINALPVELWQADEIIGWLYQFYNAEEKKAIRKRGKPTLPIEVAVINQFFTPRWVVKFLVDNTLGRLWLEMHPDSERVRTKCDYMVPEPPSSNQSPVEKVRSPKRPQDIRLIDPACGTMHFGHYAFEVFQEIYRDACEHGWVDLDDALDDTQIPLAILKHNLFGVDIDLRAVQLSALSLYLKARTALRDGGVVAEQAASLPWQVNLVCADACLTNGGLREKFLKNYADDPALQKAWRELFQEMEDIAQVGSLLRVEERFRQILSAIRPHSVRGLNEPFQGTLPGLPTPPRQIRLGESQTATGWTPNRSLGEMLEELRAFARQALEEHDVNTQVFVAEAEKTLGLLDVLMQHYDIAVMNPPFGEIGAIGYQYLKDSYKISKNVLCSFVEKALFDLAPRGYVGTVLDRTFLLKMGYEEFRREILTKRSQIIAFTDLGWGVLDDAQVEVSTLVLGPYRDKDNLASFLRARNASSTQNPFTNQDIDYFTMAQKDFLSLPHCAFAYWLPSSVRRIFQKYPPFDPEYGTAKEGIHPNDAENLLYQWWEVSHTNIGKGKKWARVANGGGYSPFYRDNDSVILYENNAQKIRELRGMRSENLQFREGITWGKRTDYLSVQYLPQGHAFTHEGHCAFPKKRELIYPFLGVFNTQLIRYTINALCGQHKTSGYFGKLPIVSSIIYSSVGDDARKSLKTKAFWDAGNEISTIFEQPWVLRFANGGLQYSCRHWKIVSNASLEILSPEKTQSNQSTPIDLQVQSLTTILDSLITIENCADNQLQNLQSSIDHEVFEMYEIPIEDRLLIERELGKRPPELVWPQMEGKSVAEKRREHVRRLISYFLRQALQVDADGLLPLSPVPGEPTALDALRAQMEAFFGEQRAFSLEGEISAELGKPLEKWLESDFIPWHTKLYKNRPIIWLLGSPSGTLRTLADYHKLRRESLVSLRSMYLNRKRESLRVELARVAEAKDYKSVGPLEDALADLDVLDQSIEQALNQGWSPDVDAGVKANILPLQQAGVVQYAIK
jgi:hypothetical protein